MSSDRLKAAPIRTGRRPRRSAIEPKVSEPISMPSRLQLNTGPMLALSMPHCWISAGAA
ncbi:hypothetical protein D3C80_2180700 [compost metagenome]